MIQAVVDRMGWRVSMYGEAEPAGDRPHVPGRVYTYLTEAEMEVLDVVLLEDVPRVLASGVLLGVVSGREHKMYLMARLEVGI